MANVAMPRKTSKSTLVIYSIIAVIILTLFMMLGAAMDFAVKPDGKVDISLISNGFSKITSKPSIIIYLLKVKGSYAQKMTFFGAMVIGIYALYKYSEEKKRLHRKGVEHGSAKWGDKNEMQSLADKDKNPTLYPKKNADGSHEFDKNGNFVGFKVDNNIVLSNEVRLSLNSRQHLLNLNVLIIGGSGSGKTRFYAKPNIMQLNTSYVITDPKGEILQSTGKMLKEAGYEVRVFNLIEMQHSNNYNPFHYVFDHKGDLSQDNIKKMVNVLFKSTKGDGEKEDFWSQKGQSLLEALVFLLFEESEYNAEFDENGKIIPETRDFSHLNFFSVTEKMRKLRYPPSGGKQPDGYFLTKNDGESDEEFETRRAEAFLSPLDKDFIELEKRKPDSLAINLLKITSEARLIGLGNGAIEKLYAHRELELPDTFVNEKNSKVDACIEKVAELYEKTNDTKGVQIIFSDIAVNGDSTHFSVYDYVKSELIEKGIPENEIIFAPKSDAKNREEIFRDINDSKYRVVIASTGTLGTGANIQKNLYALHHVDIPWKPSDFEQREGRILRQGNQNKEVEIYNYVTNGTLDSYLYQTVSNKAKFIAQILDDECPARVSEDCDEKVLTFGELQAAAQGDPRFKERIELQNEVAELKMIRNEYNRETGNIRNTVSEMPDKISKSKLKAESIEKDIKLNPVTKNPETNTSSIAIKTATGNIISDKETINEHINKALEKKSSFEDLVLDKFEVGEFKVTVRSGVQGKLIPPHIDVKSPNNETYSFETGKDNVARLINCFEKTIPAKLESTLNRITTDEQNLVQLQERLDTPFPQEDEYNEKTTRLEQLESELAGLSEVEDVIIDPEENRTEEKQETENPTQRNNDNTEDADTEERGRRRR